MLSIKNLHATADGKAILNGINLEIAAGEVHAIMGPNGSGKSTLSHVLAGKDGYEITQGEILFEGTNIADMKPEDRARLGIFLAFQYPVELPGVNNVYFLKAAVNAVRVSRGQEPLDAMEFMKVAREKAQLVELAPEFLKRAVNHGFSGGEKKRNEVFQMSMLEPKLAILDETDSGLDIDAMVSVAKGVNALRAPERSMLIITHYQRLLDYIEPDVVHVLVNGQIARTGDKTLATELESTGYAGFLG